MSERYIPYTPDDYRGRYNLLEAEKDLILKALILSGGIATKAHKLLCPTKKPYYSIGSLLKKIRQHGINLVELKKKIVDKEQKPKKPRKCRVLSEKAKGKIQGLKLKEVKLRSVT